MKSSHSVLTGPRGGGGKRVLFGSGTSGGNKLLPQEGGEREIATSLGGGVSKLPFGLLSCVHGLKARGGIAFGTHSQGADCQYGPYRAAPHRGGAWSFW